MDVFGLRDRLVDDYSSYIQSFIQICDDRIRDLVDSELKSGLLWPDPLIQLNPSFEPGHRSDELVDEGVLHEECRRIFRINKESGEGQPLRLHRHQEEAVRVASTGSNYVLTTGTGSGKSLAYIVPAVDHVLRRGPGRGIQAIVVYPMNALANSQLGELRKFLGHGYPDGRGPVTFERYTGQEKDEEKQRIMANPPDILLTNYVMLELILTRPDERRTLVQAAQGASLPCSRRTPHVSRSAGSRRCYARAPCQGCLGRRKPSVCRNIGHASGTRHLRRTAKQSCRSSLASVRCRSAAGARYRRNAPPRDFGT